MTPKYSSPTRIPARPIPCGETERRRRISEPPAGFEPLALMPKRDLRPRWKKYWQRLGDRAHSHPLAAVELHCVDCCGWERAEAACCEARTCSLWAINRRIFAAGDRRKRPQEEKREG
jgi:hypothetical protein